jgi:glycosyltransferase involved in cell wall biosynthesis
MISIVMPVYNGEKYLRNSLQSILEQTYSNFEVIIVNDASTDNTLNILKEYAAKDKRIKVFTNQNNQKLPKSLNIGFEQCAGEYFTWTSDDNLLHPNTLEILIKEIERGKDVSIVFSRYEFIDDNGEVFGKSPLYSDLNEIYCNNIVGACFLYKREVHFALGGYDVEKFLIEDYDFWMRAYRQFKFSYIPEILYSYRMHKNNLGSTRMEDIRLKKIELLKENLIFINNDDIKQRINKEISNCYYDAANFYYDLLRNRQKRKYNKDILIYRLKDIVKKIMKK